MVKDICPLPILVSVDVVVGLEFLVTTLADKHMATVLGVQG